jgi:phosphatidylglycerol:prolipoprotein diacylglycerol transferase
MYPDFRYLASGLFGVEQPWEWLSIFKTFGFFVALGFLGAAWTLIRELKRKEQQGLLLPTFTTIETGKPASANELAWMALIGFVLGYKFGGVFGNFEAVAPNPMGYLFSLQGNVLVGIAVALIMAYVRYSEKKKQALPKPEIKRVAIYPHQRVSEIILLAFVGGIVGAKVFNALETWEDFIRNPAASLLSSSGLTFYGGLITATVMIYYYARKHKIGFAYLCDAIAPGLMLAYGIGRLGCHFSGDGDWGVFNSAYITDAGGYLKAATLAEFQQTLQVSSNYFLQDFKTLADVPHIYAPAPSWLPEWLFAMNYPMNVNNDGIALTGCAGDYCAVLPAGVFPTPVYEAFTCILLFFVLWTLRKRIQRPFHLFGIYLIMNGVERFFVEKIRVNYKYDWGFLHPTQAEIISACLALAGVLILLFYKKQQGQSPAV